MAYYRCKTEKILIYPKDGIIRTSNTQKCVHCKEYFKEGGSLDMNICRECNLRYVYHIDHIEITRYKYDVNNHDSKLIMWQAEIKNN